MALFKKAILATALTASALAATSPAEARGYYRHHGGGDGAAIGIGAGILGLAVGAAIASNHNDRYRDRDYYQRDGYYYRDGYYWDRQGHRYDRDQMRRYYNGYDRGGYEGYYGNDYRQGQYSDDYRRGYSGDEYYRRGY